MPIVKDTPDPLQQPWQERLLIFVLLCAMVLYLARIVRRFRGQGLTVRRNSSGSDLADSDPDDDLEEDHSE